MQGYGDVAEGRDGQAKCWYNRSRYFQRGDYPDLADEKASRATGEAVATRDQVASDVTRWADRDAEVRELLRKMRLVAQVAWSDAHPEKIDSDNATSKVRNLHFAIRMLIESAEA